jgi:hypothetical protein
MCVASYNFRPPIVAVFRGVFFDGHSKWTKYVGEWADHNKSANLYMHMLVISHTKSSVYGYESFKCYS